MYGRDKAILVTASYDHTIRFWDAYKEEIIRTFEYGTDHIINRLEVSPDKNYLGAACTLSVKVYELNGKTDMAITNFEGYSNNVTNVGFQKDNKWIYSCSEDGSVKVSDLRAPGFQRSYTNKEPINYATLDPLEGDLYAADAAGNIKVYDLIADKLREKLTPSPDIGIRSLSVAENGSILIAGDSAGNCFVYSLKDGDELKMIQKFNAHEDYILKVALSPDFKQLATCSADKTVRVWDYHESKGFVSNKILYGHSKWVWDCAFSCDSQLLLTCSTDSTAKIWQLDNGEIIRNFQGHTKGVNCLALHDRY